MLFFAAIRQLATDELKQGVIANPVCALFAHVDDRRHYVCAGIYGYSSDSQREESIDGQLRECTAFAGKNGMHLVGTYIDRAFSAKTDDRPDFQRMIKESDKKLFDVVIVWKLDRLSRDRYDSAHYRGKHPSVDS